MELVESKAELEENIARLETYLQAPGPEHDFAIDLIRLGICFVTERGGRPFFAPSRFIGYRSNTRHDHITNEDKDGRVTNGAIGQILGTSPTPSALLEEEYAHFCTRVGTTPRSAPFGIRRKFWEVR